ncbi:MAG: Sua5/YciO/YrdC/YwlC family protein [Rhodospirillaceae bacterium]|nr:MAG: Sua5/YciO/YrdC/YwlC family protein [Rhodospirillaceae bacterium]
MMSVPILPPTEENLVLAARCIRSGGVIIAPSDTNLALTIDPWNNQAIDRAFRIKRRPATSALTIFVFNPHDWRDYATVINPALIDRMVRAVLARPAQHRGSPQRQSAQCHRSRRSHRGDRVPTQSHAARSAASCRSSGGDDLGQPVRSG